MKMTRRIMLKVTVWAFFGLLFLGNLPQGSVLFAEEEKPRMPRSEVLHGTTELVDQLIKIAKEAGCEVPESKREALINSFVEANYEALALYFALYDDP